VRAAVAAAHGVELVAVAQLGAELAAVAGRHQAEGEVVQQAEGGALLLRALARAQRRQLCSVKSEEWEGRSSRGRSRSRRSVGLTGDE
jgi:hypothetical protein